MVKQVTAASLVLAEKDGVLLVLAALVAVDSATGGHYASIADGLLSMAALDPRTRLDPALTALVDSAKLSRSGARVDLAAELAVELAEHTWDRKIPAGTH